MAGPLPSSTSSATAPLSSTALIAGAVRRLASAPEDIAANGLPAVEECTPWEELRGAYLARLAAQRPAVA
ncbi:hypothetical protein ACFZDJ_51525 [Streptomyces sp. NPDC007896]|uniref:hypothetical protein n=1 Tax=Streptomyces sp. NPDC007896 TaxID=3364784 RepID=UPI0036EAF546